MHNGFADDAVPADVRSRQDAAALYQAVATEPDTGRDDCPADLRIVDDAAVFRTAMCPVCASSGSTPSKTDRESDAEQ